MFDDEKKDVGQGELDEATVAEELFAEWQFRRVHRLDSAYFTDVRFLDWLAKDARASVADGHTTGEFNPSECVHVAESIRANAAASKARVQRIPAAPEYLAPKMRGSAAQIAREASHLGFAPFVELGVAAGTGRELWDEECSNWVRLPAGMPKGTYVALKVHGESMAPLLHSGDVVMMRLDTSFSHGDIVVARLETDGFVVKRVGQVTPRSIELHSLNPAFAPIVADRQGQVVIGKIVSVWARRKATAM